MLDPARLREMFADAVDQLERGENVRVVERSMRAAGLSNSKAKALASVAKNLAEIFTECARHA